MQSKDTVLRQLKVSCSSCSLRQLCMPVGLEATDLMRLDTLIDMRHRIAADQHLYRAGDPFEALYAVRAGIFKTYELSSEGREQVTGFHLPGEIIGFDAISTDRHTCHAAALEDAHVCAIPFSLLEALAREMPTLQRHLHRLLGREVVQDHQMLMLLGTMNAEERLAAFLLNLSERLQHRGFSSTQIRLSMSREEIGNYLGMKLETVSRAFSRLQKEGCIAIERRMLEIRDLGILKRIAGCPSQIL